LCGFERRHFLIWIIIYICIPQSLRAICRFIICSIISSWTKRMLYNAFYKYDEISNFCRIFKQDYCNDNIAEVYLWNWFLDERPYQNFTAILCDFYFFSTTWWGLLINQRRFYITQARVSFFLVKTFHNDSQPVDDLVQLENNRYVAHTRGRTLQTEWKRDEAFFGDNIS